METKVKCGKVKESYEKRKKDGFEGVDPIFFRVI